MARTPHPLPHDFPDRSIRDAVVQPNNLHDLLRRVAPDRAERFDYPHLEVLPRAFLLDDWRRRESDVLIRLPFLTAADQSLLVCILIEHRSTPDPVMPLRLLVQAVLWWEQEWRAWEQRHDRGQPLRLTPIVLHTGLDAWDTNRSLADLFASAESFQDCIPNWQTWLCDLAAHDADELLQGNEAFWQALAVVRSEREDAEQFLAVLREVLQRLEPLGQQEHVRWNQLVRLILYWAFYRRPQREHAQVLDTVHASQKNVLLQQEVSTMTQQMEMTWEQELLARGEQRGESRGEARGEARGQTAGQLQAYREMLQKLLQERFQTLPESLVQRIVSADLARLQNALVQFVHIKTLEELQL